ncbi:S1 family peptidase [Myceligenerans indicum]|uniref:S1 family peptidase n=1 Tax=Myceligenerans indicum TaxID=2593663 RepID=A0ABS1LNS7_9MICO|nr:S1 family peptidase [Myceligenerans indicum]MBL0887192.1 S1 family peptidase [Myceligenerans indicum]
MRRTRTRAFLAATAATTLVGGVWTAAVANASPVPAPDSGVIDKYEPGLLRAMERDLGLEAPEAVELMEFQAGANNTADRLAKTLDDSYAGAWLDGADAVTVAVTDTADVAAVEKAGAEAVVVDHSLDALDAWKADLDDVLADTKGVPSFYVDVESNQVVIDVNRGARAKAAKAVRKAGIPADAVTYEVTDAQPQTLMDVIGGNAYYINGSSRCSVGFAATGGFVSAGHCGSVGDSTTSPSGTFTTSNFPGSDYSYVDVASGNTPIGAVNDYAGGTVNVSGYSAAGVGTSVCRSGSTTGWHCGTIQALNATVTYSQGSVYGLIRTNVCAEPGDSGGSLLAGTLAQGMTSGGSGNCTSGGTTYFQPVGEALSAAGVSLITNGGGGGGGGGSDCSGYESSFSGSLSSGQSYAHPYFYSGAGSHAGCLDGPSGTDFDLYLQRWNGSSWSTVAQGITSSSHEEVTYSGSSGYYRWVVDAYSGSGSYTGGYDAP